MYPVYQGVDALDAWAARSEKEATGVRRSNEDSIYNMSVRLLVYAMRLCTDIPLTVQHCGALGRRWI